MGEPGTGTPGRQANLEQYENVIEAVDEKAVLAFGDRIRDLRDVEGEATVTIGTTLLTADGAERPAEIGVSVTVADDGPGIPQHELDVVTGEEPITQLILPAVSS